MTILSIVIALAALVGFAANWLRLKTIERAVTHLEKIHESSVAEEDVKLKEFPFSHPALSSAEAAGKDLTIKVSVVENLIIRGYRDNLFIELGNQSNGHRNIFRELTIEIPEGTTRVVPSLTGFILMFGKMVSNPDGTTASADIKDHHFGFEALDIFVVGVGSGTATLGVVALLSDDNGDDKWSGVVYASILFLGPHP